MKSLARMYINSSFVPKLCIS